MKISLSLLRRMSVGRQLALAFGVVLCLTGALGTGSLWQHEHRQEQSDQQDRNRPDQHRHPRASGPSVP